MNLVRILGRRFHSGDHVTQHGMSYEHVNLLGSGAGPRSLRSLRGSIIPNNLGHDQHNYGWTNYENDTYHPIHSSKVCTLSQF